MNYWFILFAVVVAVIALTMTDIIGAVFFNWLLLIAAVLLVIGLFLRKKQSPGF